MFCLPQSAHTNHMQLRVWPNWISMHPLPDCVVFTLFLLLFFVTQNNCMYGCTVSVANTYSHTLRDKHTCMNLIQLIICMLDCYTDANQPIQNILTQLSVQTVAYPNTEPIHTVYVPRFLGICTFYRKCCASRNS